MSLARASDVLFWTALGIYIVATGLHFGSFRRAALQRSATALTVAGAAVHLGMIVTRALAAGRVPWGNMYEYSTVLVFLLVAFYLVFVHRKESLRAAGPLVMVLGVATMALARGLYVEAKPLQPALNSWWLKIHVIAAITASATFTIGFVFTVLFLLKNRSEQRVAFGGSTVGAAYAGPGVLERDGGFPTDHVDDALEDSGEPGPGEQDRRGLLARLPASGTLDTWAFRATAVAFPIWTFAVIAGAIWAAKAWGRYWGWDPKEIWAFITWVVYAGYLHARATSGWRGGRAAVVNIFGFASLWICYYVVNIWISGLHSYKAG